MGPFAGRMAAKADPISISSELTTMQPLLPATGSAATAQGKQRSKTRAGDKRGEARGTPVCGQHAWDVLRCRLLYQGMAQNAQDRAHQDFQRRERKVTSKRKEGRLG